MTGAGLLIGGAIASVATLRVQIPKVEVEVIDEDNNLTILEE